MAELKARGYEISLNLREYSVLINALEAVVGAGYNPEVDEIITNLRAFGVKHDYVEMDIANKGNAV